MPEIRYMGLAALQSRARQAMITAVETGAEHFIGVAQDEIPVDTGTLRAGVTRDPAKLTARTARVKVHTGAEASDYAELVHEGTAEHDIDAKDGGALKIPGIGFRKKVHHPGTAPNPYMSRALSHFGPTYRAFMARTANRFF